METMNNKRRDNIPVRILYITSYEIARQQLDFMRHIKLTLEVTL